MDEWIPPNPKHPPPKSGEPELHRAARVGDAAAIRRLVAAGADINAVFDIGLDPDAYPNPATPLMVAAGSGDGATAETVQLLLSLGADPRTAIDSQSAATFACAGLGWNYRPGGDADRLKLVLNSGGPLPGDAEEANRTLCATAGAGDLARLRVLLSHGLNARGHFDADEARKSYRSMMASMTRYRAEQPDMFSSLPEEIRASIAESMKARELEDEERWSSAPSPYDIPLFCAARSGNAACVEAILKAGADPKIRDSSRRTAMYVAGSAEVVRLLMAIGLPLEDTDQFGWSPLCEALSDGSEGLPRVRALLEAGADVNGTHDNGYTVFMSAVGSNRHPEVLRLLVAAGADPHAISEYGYNAFHAAIDVNGEANAEESVRDTLGYLKQLGVDIERRNKGGHTPLARAIQEGTGTEVRVLCELGADPNSICPKHECGRDACTRLDLPLLFHAADGVGVHKDVKTEALLRAGADPLVKDAEGCTPLVRVAASLCAESDDYPGAFKRFFEGLRTLRFETPEMLSDREGFVSSALPVLRGYVEQFAGQIPISANSEFAESWRVEKIACIALLAAYEGWAGHGQKRKPQ